MTRIDWTKCLRLYSDSRERILNIFNTQYGKREKQNLLEERIPWRKYRARGRPITNWTSLISQWTDLTYISQYLTYISQWTRLTYIEATNRVEDRNDWQTVASSPVEPCERKGTGPCVPHRCSINLCQNADSGKQRDKKVKVYVSDMFLWTTKENFLEVKNTLSKYLRFILVFEQYPQHIVCLKVSPLFGKELTKYPEVLVWKWGCENHSLLPDKCWFSF